MQELAPICIAVAVPPHDSTYAVVTIGVAMENVRQLVMGRAGSSTDLIFLCLRCCSSHLLHWFGLGAAVGRRGSNSFQAFK